MKLTIYINGRYIQVTSAEFERLLPGEIKGKGAFETMRMYDGRIFAFADHMKRLSGGLRHFGIGLPVSRVEILEIISRLSKINRLRNSRVRIIIWQDKGGKKISMSLQPLSLPSAAKYRKGYSVMTFALKRRPTRHAHVKSIDYKELRRISKEAHRKGFDEALLLNDQGDVVEGTRTNLFLVKDGTLYTPALRCGALNGITRQKVIVCARGLKVPVRQVRVKPAALLYSDEIFLTGSTLEIMSVTRVDGEKVGGAIHERSLVRRLQRAYKEMVKREVSICPPQKQLV